MNKLWRLVVPICLVLLLAGAFAEEGYSDIQAGESDPVGTSLTSNTGTAGFFPTTDEMFGVTMPSVSFALERKPATTESDDGGVTETYEMFTIDDYDTLDQYIAAAGCSCTEHSVSNGILKLTIMKDGACFTIEYDAGNGRLTVHYPENTRIETSAGVISDAVEGIFPDVGDALGVELPSLDSVLGKLDQPEEAMSSPQYQSVYAKIRALYPNGLPEIIMASLPHKTIGLGIGNDGQKHQIYNEIQESVYYELSRYLQLCDCRLVEYTSNAEVLTAIIERDGCQFKLVFDSKDHMVEVIYPRMAHVVRMDYIDDLSLEGILPETSAAFGVFIPRPSVAIGRAASETVTQANGTLQEIYTGFTEQDYNLYSAYIQENACSVIDYSMANDILTIQLEKDGAEFEFVYEKENNKAIITYMAGTRPEVTSSPSPTPIPTPTPAPKTEPYVNSEEMIARAQLDLMKYYGCSTPTLTRSYVLRAEEFALMYFELQFIADGSIQTASFVYKGSRVPGKEPVTEFIGNDPDVYEYTLSDYLKIK